MKRSFRELCPGGFELVQRWLQAGIFAGGLRFWSGVRPGFQLPRVFVPFSVSSILDRPYATREASTRQVSVISLPPPVGREWAICLEPLRQVFGEHKTCWAPIPDFQLAEEFNFMLQMLPFVGLREPSDGEKTGAHTPTLIVTGGLGRTAHWSTRATTLGLADRAVAECRNEDKQCYTCPPPPAADTKCTRVPPPSPPMGTKALDINFLPRCTTAAFRGSNDSERSDDPHFGGCSMTGTKCETPVHHEKPAALKG